MSHEEKSLAELCKEFFTKEIDAGYLVNDKKSFHELKRKAMQVLKIKTGSMNIPKDELEKVLIEKNITIPKNMPKSTGGIDATFEKKPALLQTPEPSTLPKETGIISESPRGTLPKPESSESTESKPFLPDPQEKEKQQKIAENSIGGIIQILFERIGVLEPKVKPKDEKEKLEQSEQLRKDIDDFSNELGGVLYDNGIQLPSFVKYIDLGIKGYKAIAQPLLSKVGDADPETPQTQEEKDREEKLKNV